MEYIFPMTEVKDHIANSSCFSLSGNTFYFQSRPPFSTCIFMGKVERSCSESSIDSSLLLQVSTFWKNWVIDYLDNHKLLQRFSRWFFYCLTQQKRSYKLLCSCKFQVQFVTKYECPRSIREQAPFFQK